MVWNRFFQGESNHTSSRQPLGPHPSKLEMQRKGCVVFEKSSNIQQAPGWKRKFTKTIDGKKTKKRFEAS